MKKTIVIIFAVMVMGLGIAYMTTGQVHSTAKAPSDKKCTDSDNGLNYYEYGYVTYGNKEYADKCLGKFLFERYCGKSLPRVKMYRCQNGCSDGECISICANECSYAGLQDCVSDPEERGYYRTCGNYDTDECLEWSTTFTQCPSRLPLCWIDSCIIPAQI